MLNSVGTNTDSTHDTPASTIDRNGIEGQIPIVQITPVLRTNYGIGLLGFVGIAQEKSTKKGGKNHDLPFTS